ncbi:carbon-nitrogen hydrolase family protein [Alkaliphilus crotonatoxidans]
MKKFTVAVCQMMVTDHKEQNLKKAESLIRTAVKERDAQLVVLPEMFNCPYENQYFPLFAEEYGGLTTSFLSRLAGELKIYLIGGSIPEKQDNQIFNTSYVYNPHGDLIGKHRKMHLFDIDIPNGIRFKESDTLGAGSQATVFETEFCTMGLGICYDMRFPELMRLMALKGAKVIIVPAAFNMTTGPAHWSSLLQVRALDNQVYFVAASPARDLKANYHAYGHSAIIDPWGQAIAQAGEGEAVVYGEIDLSYVEKIRSQLPLLQHLRKDCYAVVEQNGKKL